MLLVIIWGDRPRFLKKMIVCLIFFAVQIHAAVDPTENDRRNRLDEIALTPAVFDFLYQAGVLTTTDLQRFIRSGEIFDRFPNRSGSAADNPKEILNLANDLGLLSGEVPFRVAKLAERFGMKFKKTFSPQSWDYRTSFIVVQRNLAIAAIGHLYQLNRAVAISPFPLDGLFFIGLIQMERAAKQHRGSHVTRWVASSKRLMGRYKRWADKVAKPPDHSVDEFLANLFLAYKIAQPEFDPEGDPWAHLLFSRLGVPVGCRQLLTGPKKI
jgi:hypothetical protein